MSINFTIEDIKEFIKEDGLKLPINLKLNDPVQFTDSELIEFITINKKPTAGDIEDLPVTGQTMKDWQKPLSKMTGQTTVLIRKLSAKDFVALTEICGYFLGSSQKTGEEA